MTAGFAAAKEDEKMLKNVMAKFACLFFSLGFLCVAQTFAQTKTCDLQLEVIQKPESADAKKIPIKDAEANSVGKETNKVVKADLKEGMPYFAKLPEGQYRLSVTKKGHQTTIKLIDLNCGSAGNQGVISEIIILWKGDKKQTKLMFSKPIPITEFSQPTQSNTTSDLDPKIFQGGMVARKATKLVNPSYPLEARAARAGGAVRVQLLIDESGKVISAKAASGDPLLHRAAERAAFKSKFSPTLLNGQPVKVSGFIVYNFAP